MYLTHRARNGTKTAIFVDEGDEGDEAAPLIGCYTLNYNQRKEMSAY